MARRSTRLKGYIAHVAPSRSARFWTIVRTSDNSVYFAYGGNYIDRDVPRVGQPVEFTILPANPSRGKYDRATEIMVIKKPRTGRVALLWIDGALRLMLGGRELGALDLASGM